MELHFGLNLNCKKRLPNRLTNGKIGRRNDLLVFRSIKGGNECIMKKHIVFICTIAMSIMLCGCGGAIPEMTDTETAVITEYATNLLVKYSTLSDRALLNEKELEEGILEEAAERERLLKVKELENMYLNGTVEVETEQNDLQEGESGTAEVSPEPQLSVDEFFTEGNFSIDYSSYILCKSYPETDEEEFFVAMDATPGNQLCIVKFNVSNLTASDQALDMYAKRGRFSLKLEDGSTVSAQSTLLMDDLSTYAGTIPAGASEELVLVFEVSDSVAQMGNMKLIMKDQNGENTLTLQ